MFSIQTKIVLSLIAMSFLAIVLGGITASQIMIKRFNEVVVSRASHGLLHEAAEYYNHYGSWESAVSAESFRSFASKINPDALRAKRNNASAGQEAGRPLQREFLGFGGPPPPFVVTDLDGQVRIPTPNSKLGEIFSAQKLSKGTPLMSGDTLIGYAFSESRLVLSDLEQQYLSSLKDSLWFSVLLVAAVAIPIGLLIGRRLASPINSLSNAIQSIQPDTIQQKVPVTSNDEIGRLSESFNQMTEDMSTFVDVIQKQKDKIVETEALRKEGIASISHELMTPLNTSVAQVNAMIDGIRPSDEQQMRNLSGSLSQLTKLVDDLFQLSLADVNALECRKETIDFSMLIKEAVDTRTADFQQKSFKVVTHVPEQLDVIGDATRLRQIIDNLLENCFRYTNTGGEIRIELDSREQFAELTISDNGPGVSMDNLGSLFERFFREESSRNKSTGGTGLGLSLVKAWAEAQDGSAQAFLSAEGGLGIRTSIPMAQS